MGDSKNDIRYSINDIRYSINVCYMFRVFIFFLFCLMSCNFKSQKKGTPKEFINNVIVDSLIYSKDSAKVLAELYMKMKNHEASFENPEYFDFTELIIDTLIYDITLNKIAVFVVAKNPTNRNPYSDSKLPYYYNANCYIGKRNFNDSSLFELECLCRFSEINFDDKETAVEGLKEDFFIELATVLDENKQPVFRYNINDKRFWDSPTGWKGMFEETRSKNENILFEKLKDTLIVYDIKGISSESAEAKVNYVNSRITKSETNIYGETGQGTILYNFEKYKIRVSETRFSYKSQIQNTTSGKDMQLEYKVNYYIDFNGRIIGEEIPYRIDIFKMFKEKVPFILK